MAYTLFFLVGVLTIVLIFLLLRQLQPTAYSQFMLRLIPPVKPKLNSQSQQQELIGQQRQVADLTALKAQHFRQVDYLLKWGSFAESYGTGRPAQRRTA